MCLRRQKVVENMLGVLNNVIEEGFISCFAQFSKGREVPRHELSVCTAANKRINSLSLGFRVEPHQALDA